MKGFWANSVASYSDPAVGALESYLSDYIKAMLSEWMGAAVFSLSKTPVTLSIHVRVPIVAGKVW